MMTQFRQIMGNTEGCFHLSGSSRTIANGELYQKLKEITWNCLPGSGNKFFADAKERIPCPDVRK
jgi:hypothetical protein